jgi:hypothetical protein
MVYKELTVMLLLILGEGRDRGHEVANGSTLVTKEKYKVNR